MRRLERRCAWVAIATIAAITLTAAAAFAAPIQSKMTTEAQGERAQMQARAGVALETSGIVAKLKAFGLSDEQIQQRLSQLSADELQALVAGAETIAAAGAEPSLSTTTWLLIIVILLILVD